MSCKPFKPCALDVIISKEAPQFYNEEELAQIMDLESKLLSRIEARSKKNNIEETTNKKRCRKDEDIAEKERVKKISRNVIVFKSTSSDLPIKFKNHINELNGYDVKFVMEKALSVTDVNKNNSRLSIPPKETKCKFLTEAEYASLDTRKETGGVYAMQVVVFDPCLREFTSELKKWNMKTTSILNLTKNWFEIVKANNFKINHVLQLWSFRVDTKLYFLLNKV
ncbi:hypothetical protein RJT34_05751 [Clitoria ternatea]|uniref:B3 domain-containing protein n=1 Tax=Clitoria ternatea TaxID=43366 RepID=A0AAN9K3F3_CLITE